MATKVVISDFTTGYQTDKPDFLFSNDAFPLLINAFLWRGKLLKKPGARKLGHLQREVSLTGINLDGSGDLSATNLITTFSLETGSTIAAGSISFSDGTNTYTEPSNFDGTLTGAPGGSGTIDYATGVITITGGAASQPLTGTFDYHPNLPVMGIEDFDDNNRTSTAALNLFETVYFDTTYAYEFISDVFTDVSFYKTTHGAVTWHGGNFQQFWSDNYQNAMFLTNNVPGMHHVVPATVTPGSPTAFTTTNDDLETGDVVFLNEFTGTGASTINYETATVTRVGAGSYTVPINTTALTLSNGIVQYLIKTPTETATQDGIRWFDGFDNAAPFDTGFVNFAPPLDNLGTSDTTYLCGARMIIPYGNRLLAIGTFEATSANARAGTFDFYQNRIRYCQVNGTCFYADNPAGGTATADAWISNVQGFGGFIDIDSSDRILTAAISQDTLVLGMEGSQKRVNLTGIESQPYTVQTISPELGSESTFSIVQLDQGVLTAGDYGFIFTTSYNAQRFDERIPDTIYQIQNNYQGNERVCAARDYQNEICYFTYPDNEILADTGNSLIYPNKTLLYNYRNNSFAIFKESYTTYGSFRSTTGEFWEDLDYFTWEEWLKPWESGSTSARTPFVSGGNQQGFVMLKYAQTANDPSLNITAVSSQQLTVPGHMLEGGDYVGFQNLGTNTISSINRILRVIDFDTIEIEGSFTATPGVTELVVIDNIDVVTKNFAPGWSMGKGVRIGPCQFLSERTTNGEYTVQLLSSTNPQAINTPSIFPSLITSQIVNTKPEDNIGLNANQNDQSLIWHRFSTPVIGHVAQLRFTMSEEQMLNQDISREAWSLYAMVLTLSPAGILA